ncbi:glycosyltransferase 61 family protein [Tatumella ptyseos]|uniref:glycosyltransferase 61 family protein n=1 Tax=Tatumella ptyseos TaxID=82987 RepID=UPI0023F54074|nr:glycosyltransferase 61 family protein [Tatumella ptyseos]
MHKSLDVLCVSQGIVLPYVKNKGWGAGGVVSQEGEFIHESIYTDWMTFGELYSYEESEVFYEPCDAIWMGKFNEHWGHFLLDDISRLWYVLENYNNEKIVYVSENNVVSGNYEIFLISLGIPKENILRVKSVTRFNKVIIPQCSKMNGNIYPEYRMIFSRVIDFLMKGDVENNKYNKVYFSRRNFADAGKKEIGEKEIERYLNSKGYISISPESLSLKDQVVMWNSCNSIACFNGTIPLNILFMRDRDLDLLVLNKTSRLHKNLDDVLSIFHKLNVNCIDVYNDFYDKYVRFLGEGPFVLNNTSKLMCHFNEGAKTSNSFANRFKISHFMFFIFFISKRFLKSKFKLIYHFYLKVRK